jgi:plasmid maintenance system antidote protein VapI
MLSPTILAEKEFQKALLAFATALGINPDELFDLMGIERNHMIRLTKKQRQITLKFKGRFEQFLKNVDALAELPDAEKNAKTEALFNDMLRNLLPIPPKTNPILWLLSRLNLSPDPRNAEFFAGTHYSEYLDALQDLMRQINQSGNITLVDEFSRNARSHPDFRAMAQKLRPNEIPKAIMEMFTRKRKSLDLATMNKCKHNYLDMTSYAFEKQARLMLGVCRTFKTGVKQNYLDLKKRRLKDILDDLGAEPVAILCTGINTNIRNALAHGSIAFAPSKHEVELTLKGEQSTNGMSSVSA